VSRQAIAAALAREDLTGGERLVAFSLASFAGRAGRAWPGAPAAAARAGLSRSRYLYDRDKLVQRGLLVVEERASGRGRASTVALRFASDGPWWEGDINAELFEAVLSRTRTRGPARLRLAAMAALADADGVVRGVSNDELCAATGLEDRTYRRARPELLKSGELVLLSGARGRGNTNVWQVRPLAETAAPSRPVSSRRRVVPPAGARPLLASVASTDGADGVGEAPPRADSSTFESGAAASGKCPDLPGVSTGKGGQDRTVSEPNCAAVPGVSPVKGGQDRTLFDGQPAENPAKKGAQNPAEDPAANARAGSEPQNPGIPEDPPTPLAGGRPARSMMIEQTFITDRLRQRRRMVPVDLDAVRLGLGTPTAADRDDWQRIRQRLEGMVGESTFAIWLEPAELIAVDGDRRLVVAVPAATASWTTARFGRLMARCADRAGRELRFASEPEAHASGGAERGVQQPRQKEVAG
jgi:hypothetical protein